MSRTSETSLKRIFTLFACFIRIIMARVRVIEISNGKRFRDYANILTVLVINLHLNLRFKFKLIFDITFVFCDNPKYGIQILKTLGTKNKIKKHLKTYPKPLKVQNRKDTSKHEKKNLNIFSKINNFLHYNNVFKHVSCKRKCYCILIPKLFNSSFRKWNEKKLNAQSPNA